MLFRVECLNCPLAERDGCAADCCSFWPFLNLKRAEECFSSGNTYAMRGKKDNFGN